MTQRASLRPAPQLQVPAQRATTDPGRMTCRVASGRAAEPSVMQIGQILVEQRWVDPEALGRALAEQRDPGDPGTTGMRICSLLIARGQLDPDCAARALANQHHVAGVLQKHLENRERALAALLPAALARACVALPIGRTRHRELIVCVRDPSAALCATLAAAVSGPIVIAVAPARQLEQLVELTYGAADHADHADHAPDASVDVDLSTRVIPTLHHDDVDVDLHTRQLPVIGDGLGDLGSMTLVELDDERVTKDPSQSGQHTAVLPRTTTAPHPPPRTVTSPQRTLSPPRTLTPPTRAAPGNALAALPLPLPAALAAIERATEHDTATAAAMRYLAGRFPHAVLFAISEGAALGVCGHGDHLTDEVIEAITVPLSAPSLVQAAHDTRRPATAAPDHAGAIQDRLARTLGSPRAFAAVPIEVGARVAYVIAVGDATGDATAAAQELERLAGALAAAFGRMPAA